MTKCFWKRLSFYNKVKPSLVCGRVSRRETPRGAQLCPCKTPANASPWFGKVLASCVNISTTPLHKLLDKTGSHKLQESHSIHNSSRFLFTPCALIYILFGSHSRCGCSSPVSRRRCNQQNYAYPRFVPAYNNHKNVPLFSENSVTQSSYAADMRATFSLMCPEDSNAFGLFSSVTNID